MSQNKQPAQPEKRTLFKTALAAGAIGVAGYFAGKKQGEAAAETQNNNIPSWPIRVTASIRQASSRHTSSSASCVLLTLPPKTPNNLKTYSAP